MLASRMSRFLAIAASALSLSACDYECGTAGGTEANGTVRDDAGVSIATVVASVADHVNPSFLRLSVGVSGLNGTGAPLRGHVTRARLVTETGELIAEIPTSIETLYLTTVVALNMDLPSQREYDRVRTVLLTERAKVVLDTDLAGREHIEAILTDTHDVPANLGRCSIS